MNTTATRAKTIDYRILRFIKQELNKEGAYLLPLRLFIGMGWLRAFAEKVADPGWHNGTVLAAFLEERLAGNHVVFPFYRVEHPVKIRRLGERARASTSQAWHHARLIR